MKDFSMNKGLLVSLFSGISLFTFGGKPQQPHAHRLDPLPPAQQPLAGFKITVESKKQGDVAHKKSEAEKVSSEPEKKPYKTPSNHNRHQSPVAIHPVSENDLESVHSALDLVSRRSARQDVSCWDKDGCICSTRRDCCICATMVVVIASVCIPFGVRTIAPDLRSEGFNNASSSTGMNFNYSTNPLNKEE